MESEVGVVTGVTSAITGASTFSSSSAQEKMMRLKRDMRIMYKTLFIFSLHQLMSGNKFEKSYIHILEPETLSRESRVTESAQEIDDSIPLY